MPIDITSIVIAAVIPIIEAMMVPAAVVGVAFLIMYFTMRQIKIITGEIMGPLPTIEESLLEQGQGACWHDGIGATIEGHQGEHCTDDHTNDELPLVNTDRSDLPDITNAAEFIDSDEMREYMRQFD